MLQMEDESGIDAKILAVPIDKLSSLYHQVKTWKDLPEQLTQSIQHFFEHYKDLEAGKWVKVTGWVGPEQARMEIQTSMERYKKI
jgi:inorganic pyrophosphatase